jgi:hypothetical protein
MKRPSHKELYGKILEARKAVANDLVNLINQDAIVCDAMELGYLIESDLIGVLTSLLNEITPVNYAGKKPPEKSYEQQIEDLDLFAFRVESSWFNCAVYFKFALYNNELWIVSLHQNRKKKEVP